MILFMVEIVGNLLEGGDPFGYPKVTEFYPCEGPEPAAERPKEPVTTFSSDAEAIYVCGCLDTSGSVYLRFLLVYQDESLGWFARSQYQKGYIHEQIPLSQRRPGHYRVEVHYMRDELAATELTIVP
jgi:hypothetical protein